MANNGNGLIPVNVMQVPYETSPPRGVVEGRGSVVKSAVGNLALQVVDTPTGNWRDSAGCIGSDPDLFFPDPSDEVLEAKAKAVCANCPVREQCLEHALSKPEKEGIWGGLNERERRKLLRQRRIAVRQSGTR